MNTKTLVNLTDAVTESMKRGNDWYGETITSVRLTDDFIPEDPFPYRQLYAEGQDGGRTSGNWTIHDGRVYVRQNGWDAPWVRVDWSEIDTENRKIITEARAKKRWGDNIEYELCGFTNATNFLSREEMKKGGNRFLWELQRAIENIWPMRTMDLFGHCEWIRAGSFTYMEKQYSFLVKGRKGTYRCMEHEHYANMEFEILDTYTTPSGMTVDIRDQGIKNPDEMGSIVLKIGNVR